MQISWRIATLELSIQISITASHLIQVRVTALQWRHNGRDGVSNHQPHDCLLNRFFRRTDQGQHQSFAPLAFLCGIHRWPVKSPHKWPVTRKMFPFDHVIMVYRLNQLVDVASCLHEILLGVWYMGIEFSFKSQDNVLFIRMVITFQYLEPPERTSETDSEEIRYSKWQLLRFLLAIVYFIVKIMTYGYHGVSSHRQTRMFVQLFIRMNKEEAPDIRTTGPYWGESTGDWQIPHADHLCRNIFFVMTFLCEIMAGMKIGHTASVLRTLLSWISYVKWEWY